MYKETSETENKETDKQVFSAPKTFGIDENSWLVLM